MIQLNRTERLQIRHHRNDRWQNYVEGALTSASTIKKHVIRRSGKVFTGCKVVSADERSRIQNLKKLLEPTNRS